MTLVGFGNMKSLLWNPFDLCLKRTASLLTEILGLLFDVSAWMYTSAFAIKLKLPLSVVLLQSKLLRKPKLGKCSLDCCERATS